MSTSGTFSSIKDGALAALAGAAIVAVLSACDLPFNLSQPTTRALESGATDGLTSATSFEITGSYTDRSAALSTTASGARGSTSTANHWTIDLQESRPDTQHVVISTATVQLEAIVLGGTGYFRGHEFLAQHMGTDPLSQNLVKAAGSSWWKGSVGLAPRLPDLTYGVSFRATFLGTAVTKRSDHVSVDGLDAVDLSGARADVYIAATPPYRLLRVHLKAGVTIDGVSDADLRFSNYNKDFAIAAPTDVIDFSNLSTLTPIYTVVSVDTSACGSTCAVSAQLKNLGGMRPAKAPSTITFTMSDPASGRTLGSCQAQVRPDVGFNSTTTVGCTIGGLSGPPANATVVTATADNPGQA
jgi:hypothetical protein